MDTHTRLTRALVGIVSIGVGVALSAPGVAAPTVKGDTAAWAEIVAAYRKLNSLPGYRIKGDVSGGGPGGGSFVYEVAPPNRAYHEIQESPRGKSETFSVGSKIISKFSGAGVPGGTKCITLARDPNRIPLLRDPEDPQDTSVYTVARKPDSVIDGTAVHVYGVTIASPRGGQEISETIYIGTQTDLPRRVVTTVAITMANQGTTQTMTSTANFYDYGAKITIVLPNC